MVATDTSSSYVCDTLPPARLAPVAVSLPLHETVTPTSTPTPEPDNTSSSPPQEIIPRKLCVRHQRMADEGINLKLQQSLDALSVQERGAVNSVWANFSSASHPRRALILQGLLTMCCFSQLSLLTEQLAHLIRIDPFTIFPREVSLTVLGYLDAMSLCRAAQVSKLWKHLADDDTLWRGICEQHIGQKCNKCGWGLPLLEKKRIHMAYSYTPASRPQSKRALDTVQCERSPKRLHAEPSCSQSQQPPDDTQDVSRLTSSCVSSPESLLVPDLPHLQSVTRPWKDVYCERLTIERNWRRGRCTVRTLKGHTDGVMCLQYSDNLLHPAYPILITGSYDRTARVWNLETGEELIVLRGHTRAVRTLQFDEVKLITGSMDHTIRVWDWRKGRCIRTLEGHTEGVVCLNYDSNVLASGSVDSTVRVWNLRTGGAFTLRGHCDWVNAVQLWDSNRDAEQVASISSAPLLDSLPSSSANAAPQIDPGKMLFSASDDGTIRLWDLTLRTCVRQLVGHVGQVQSMRLLAVDECNEGDDRESRNSSRDTSPTALRSARASPSPRDMSTEDTRAPVLISGSLDNTIKLWDIDTGKATRTLFGHIEGVWAVASDKLRLVSGSHDRTIKVWNREDGRCTATLVGHRGAVTCLALGEDKIVSGSDDGDVRIWSFSG